MTRIKKLSFVLIGLLVVSFMLSWVGNKDRVSSFDKSLFAIADTTQIRGIIIESNGQTISIKRGEEQWSLNDTYRVDPQLVYLSQRILNAVQTQRPVSPSNFVAIKSDLQESGRLINVELSDGQSKKFYAGGNAAKTTAYFGNEDLTEIFSVAIPGYKSYLSGIFELSLNQWRDRVLFASDWRTIQDLNINYTDPTQPDLTIFFDNKFLAVKEVDLLDTATLMNYLQPMGFFQVNDYLDKGNFTRYDSLLAVEPIAELTLKDIDSSKNSTLIIYPKIPGERFYLLTDESDEMIVVDQQRMEKLLVTSSFFEEN
ncbi:MAG: hypothetical protein ABJF04_04485 [Reichenbachiella sp.]|uniref:hypothetical protein n=1 Tax=Reichenbachiella sp. TaxID=2184521 RepID=UPI003262DB8A